MNDESARSRVEILFTSYVSVSWQNDLAWVIKEDLAITVRHVLVAVSPQLLKVRFESGLRFTKLHLKENFKEFMNHAIWLPNIFEFLNIGRPYMHDKGW